MKFLSVAAALSIISAVQAGTVLVTQTDVVTVDAQGNPVYQSSSAAPSSSAYSSSAPSSSVEAQTSSSVEAQTSSYVEPSSSSAPAETSSVNNQQGQAKLGMFNQESSAPASSTTQAAVSSSVEATSVTAAASSSSTKGGLNWNPFAPSTLISKTVSSSSASSTSTSSTGGGDDDDFKNNILDAHNKKRSQHGVLKLSWDEDAYQYAKDYANKYDCSGDLQHSGGSFGENLAVGYKDGSSAVDAWYDEGKNYDYSSASSFDHFTQVIWKSTTKVGCAYKDCSSENWGKYIVCSYDPAGNIVGKGKANLIQ